MLEPLKCISYKAVELTVGVSIVVIVAVSLVMIMRRFIAIAEAIEWFMSYTLKLDFIEKRC